VWQACTRKRGLSLIRDPPTPSIAAPMHTGAAVVPLVLTKNALGIAGAAYFVGLFVYAISLYIS
jgi:hypothetical protein